VLVGYARVSTPDQKLDLQLDALTQAGAERVFSDVASGAKSDRPGRADAMDFAREGDTIVVWRLDRLGRSMPDLVATVDALRERGVGFRSLTEGIDTTTATGKLVFNIFASLAEFERELIRERTKAGIESARARGRKGGRKPKLTPAKVELASKMMKDKTITIREVCDAVGVSSTTLYRHVAPDGTIRQLPKPR
jgi:DNA invertase Pin-like site-specific DNA recombinase